MGKRRTDHAVRGRERLTERAEDRLLSIVERVLDDALESAKLNRDILRREFVRPEEPPIRNGDPLLHKVHEPMIPPTHHSRFIEEWRENGAEGGSGPV